MSKEQLQGMRGAYIAKEVQSKVIKSNKHIRRSSKDSRIKKSMEKLRDFMPNKPPKVEVDLEKLFEDQAIDLDEPDDEPIDMERQVVKLDGLISELMNEG